MKSSFMYKYYGYLMEENEAPLGAIPPPAAEPMKSAIADGGDDLAELDFIREFFPDTCYFNPV